MCGAVEAVGQDGVGEISEQVPLLLAARRTRVQDLLIAQDQ